MLKSLDAFDEVPMFHADDLAKLNNFSSAGGFQPKFLTADKKTFIKVQANLSGVLMRDWMVEIIASDICELLDIPCIKQRHCRVTLRGKVYDAVMSDNFELEGLVFLPFKSLLNRNYKSTSDDDFIRLGAAAKLRWCARALSSYAGLAYDECEKYMLDLAVVDCLVGNSDRHDNNYGVYIDQNTSRMKIGMIFDSGMGMFENGYYRDSYSSFDEVMRNAYVAPYGEDPFDLVRVLKVEFDLSRYQFEKLRGYHPCFPNEFAEEYYRMMLSEFGVQLV